MTLSVRVWTTMYSSSTPKASNRRSGATARAGEVEAGSGCGGVMRSYAILVCLGRASMQLIFDPAADDRRHRAARHLVTAVGAVLALRLELLRVDGPGQLGIDDRHIGVGAGAE